MARLLVEYDVVMEDPDERVLVVPTDQRDFAALEARDDIPETSWHTRGRFMVWNAMRRKKLTTATWEDFNRDLCASIAARGEESDDSEDGEDEQGLDPGRTSPSDAS